MVCDDPGGTYIQIVNAIRSNFKIVVYTLFVDVDGIADDVKDAGACRCGTNTFRCNVIMCKGLGISKIS